LFAVINELTITPGGTFRIRIPINEPIVTLALAKIAVIHNPTGTK